MLKSLTTGLNQGGCQIFTGPRVKGHTLHSLGGRREGGKKEGRQAGSKMIGPNGSYHSVAQRSWVRCAVISRGMPVPAADAALLPPAAGGLHCLHGPAPSQPVWWDW